MHRERCDVCGQPAAIHETVIEAGGALERNRCADHGDATWRHAAARVESSLHADRQSLLEELRMIVEKDPEAWGR